VLIRQVATSFFLLLLLFFVDIDTPPSYHEQVWGPVFSFF